MFGENETYKGMLDADTIQAKMKEKIKKKISDK